MTTSMSPSEPKTAAAKAERHGARIGVRGFAVVAVLAVGAVGARALPDRDARDDEKAAVEARAKTVRATRSLAPLPKGVEAVSVHDPFDSEDCSSCHASDDKDNPGAVEDTSSALCLGCHDNPAAGVKGVFHKHGGAGGRCLDCHNPHNSLQEHLLHAPPQKLCASCHVDKERGAFEHQPIEAPGSCTKCHTPHGSATDARLLRSAYPATFYAPYVRGAYALCFSCHDPKLVEQAKTTTATMFRDGDKNLHTVHVMRDDKGRSCGACHDMHAGKRRNLVHDDVAFGSHGWRLPLGFRQTDDGGSCARTCHMARSYSRRR